MTDILGANKSFLDGFAVHWCIQSSSFLVYFYFLLCTTCTVVVKLMLARSAVWPQSVVWATHTSGDTNPNLGCVGHRYQWGGGLKLEVGGVCFEG